jgi:deferrochelatase/peroxidase EfeB
MGATRRRFLSAAGLTGLGAGALAGRGGPATAAAPVVPFYGPHQAGIATPAQEHLQFAAFDVTAGSKAGLRDLLRAWSTASAAMSVGAAPAGDTGEAVGLAPAQLTVTFGFGAGLFTARFGLAGHRPAPLAELPAFPGDALQAGLSGGDLGVQVCANDPQVAFHAMHELMRLARGAARPRWLLAGFGRTGTSTRQPLPRNLLGFQDGTANIMVEHTSVVEQFVWAQAPASPPWMRGGSYLVARRIQVSLGAWDDAGTAAQQRAVGRHKLTGTQLAPLPADAHIRLASPALNDGQRLLRRGYSYTGGADAATGDPVTGLLFLCYQADPRRQFTPIQRRIAGADGLSPFVTPIGSALFACPPGARRGGYVGEGLLR